MCSVKYTRHEIGLRLALCAINPGVVLALQQHTMKETSDWLENILYQERIIPWLFIIRLKRSHMPIFLYVFPLPAGRESVK